MVLRIRCGQISGCTNAETDNRTTSLIGGLYMWHKDSKGNWYMAEDEISESGEAGSIMDGDPVWVDKIPAVSSFSLGPDSSVYLFSSLARGA
ncbi:MAG: hypothetical protein STSR0007_09800 [Thermovirga sp.]